MKKDNSKYYFTLILLAYILIYFFKIDKTVFSFQVCHRSPNQSYNEQPFSENSICSVCTISGFSQFIKSRVSENRSFGYISDWSSVLYSYNLSVHHFLKCQKLFVVPTLKIVSIIHKQNIFHKSTEEDNPNYRLFS
jgi:hypothetical protein